MIAAGRWSQFTPDRVVPPGPKWIGVKAHFREANPAPSTDLYFFESGYCGVQPVAADVVNACAMVRSDRRPRCRMFSRSTHGWPNGPPRGLPLMQPVSTAPLIYRQPQPTRDNMLFAGDAAAFIDPFVGDGISIALRSGQGGGTMPQPSFLGRSWLSPSVPPTMSGVFAAIRAAAVGGLPRSVSAVTAGAGARWQCFRVAAASRTYAFGDS